MIFNKTSRAIIAASATALLTIPAIVNAAGWSCGDDLHFDYGKADGCVAITSPDENIAWLRAGNENFVGDTFTNLTAQSDAAKRSATVTNGQRPKAVVLTCSDSRVPPEILFNKGLGEVFIVRVAGNIIAKHEIGSIEYGLEHLGANLIVVLGHERCGAVKATFDSHGTAADLGPNLNSLVTAIDPAVTAVVGSGTAGKAVVGSPEEAAQVEECVIENIKLVTESLESQSAIVKEFVELGRAKIVTAKYDLDDGIVSFFPTTEIATPVTSTTATLHGIINDNSLAVTASFEYGTTTAYGTTVSAGTVGVGTDPVEISAGITGLACGTTYHYRAIAENINETTSGLDATFTTSPCAVTTPALSYPAKTGNTFTVTRVEPNGTTVPVYTGTAKSYTDVSALLPNTTYSYYVTSDTDPTQTNLISIRTPLFNGWNIIGVPYDTTGIPAADLFGTRVRDVYEWVPLGSVNPDNNGQYTVVSTLTPGKGYFVRAVSSTTMLAVTGTPNPAASTVTLNPGWSLISNPSLSNMTSVGASWLIDGSALNNAVSANKIGADLYWWNGSTYNSWKINDLVTPANSAIIEPWKAYWMLNMDTIPHTLTIQ